MEEDGDRAAEGEDQEHHVDDGQEEGSGGGGGGNVFPGGRVADQEAYAPAFVPATATPGLQDPHGAARAAGSVTSSAPAYGQTITSSALAAAGHVLPFVEAPAPSPPYAKTLGSPLHRELLDPSAPPYAASTGQAGLVPYSSPFLPASGSGHGELDWGRLLQREISSAASASPGSHLVSSPSGGYSPTPSTSSLFLPPSPPVYAPRTSSSFTPAAMSAHSAGLQVPYQDTYTAAYSATYPWNLPTRFRLPFVPGARPSAPSAVFVPSVVNSHIPLPPPSLVGAVPPAALPHAHRAPPLGPHGYQALWTAETTSPSFATTGPASSSVPADVYKTRLCNTFMRSGVCRRSPNCTFAHGVQELREQGPCRYFSTGQLCPRGAKCPYRHSYATHA